jgi:hypothetical protein
MRLAGTEGHAAAAVGQPAVNGGLLLDAGLGDLAHLTLGRPLASHAKRRSTPVDPLAVAALEYGDLPDWLAGKPGSSAAGTRGGP